MSVCVVDDGNGYLQIDTATETTSCDEYLLLTANEHQDLLAGSLANVTEVLNSLFAFDFETFSLIQGTIILTFLTGHGVGRVLKILGKS